MHIMGKQKAFKKLHSTKKQLLTALVLSSILGMGFGAAPAWAESKTDQDTDSRTPLVSQVNGVGTVSNGSDTAVTDGLTAALAAWREAHEAVQLRQDSQGAGEVANSFTPVFTSSVDASYLGARQIPLLASITTPIAQTVPALVEADINAPASVLASAPPAERGAWSVEHDVDAKFTPYVMVGGHNLRYNTSSTVDTNGFNGELGFVKRIFEERHADTIMPFMEYGTGNYTSYKNGSRGDGSQRYIGAGLLVRRDQSNGVHYEGLVRGGHLSGDYSGNAGLYHANYDSGANYFAAHAGIGRIYHQDDNDYNLYGKLFYSYLSSDTVQLHSDVGSFDYELEPVTSLWTRLGFRWTKHLDPDVTSFYAGVGWDYEFNGKAKARYQDYTTPEASMKGSSEFLELGWQSKSNKNNPWGADVRVTGWHGVKQGFTYGVTITRRM